MKRLNKGFSLVELSVAMVALGIVLLAAMGYWQRSAGQRVAVAQQTVQQQSHDALLGFVHANFRLPCPAVDAGGLENCAIAGGFVRHVGMVPWRTLGLPRPEAGRLRYAVYREFAGNAPDDRDLATARDRMNPLRVKSAFPKPQNSAIAPNPNAPPVPLALAGLLGATQSGVPGSPLNTACNPANSPPCPAPAGRTASVNMVDICLALNTASGLNAALPANLAVLQDGVRRAMAFVVVAPGLLDADGDGQIFDGLNALASDTNPTYEPARRSKSDVYDDQVLAVSPTELFSQLNCGTGLAAVSHAHFNTAIGAFTLERALYDYRDQLYVGVLLATADVGASVAGTLVALAVTGDGLQSATSALADTFASAGARAFQIGIAAVGVAAAVIGVASAVASTARSATALGVSIDSHAKSAAHTTAMTDLAISINSNALLADAIGF